MHVRQIPGRRGAEIGGWLCCPQACLGVSIRSSIEERDPLDPTDRRERIMRL
jgi:hypothetical protein